VKSQRGKNDPPIRENRRSRREAGECGRLDVEWLNRRMWYLAPLFIEMDDAALERWHKDFGKVESLVPDWSLLKAVPEEGKRTEVGED
jgi:hypothetical protein